MRQPFTAEEARARATDTSAWLPHGQARFTATLNLYADLLEREGDLQRRIDFMLTQWEDFRAIALKRPHDDLCAVLVERLSANVSNFIAQLRSEE